MHSLCGTSTCSTDSINLAIIHILPNVTSHLSPVQGGWQTHEKVCFSLSGKQEPPLRHLEIRHP